MGLLELPSELLMAITKWLPTPAPFAMVHPALQKVAADRLYSDITFTWSRDDPVPRIRLLLRTLLERPELRQYVRNLNLQCDRLVLPVTKGGQPEAFQLEDTGLDIAEGQLVSEIQSLGFAKQELASEWANKIRLGNSDAVVALLVALTPNIRRLSLSPKWTVDLTHLGLVFKTALCPSHLTASRLPTYKDLTFVSLTPLFLEEHLFDAPAEDNILALFYLPGVEELGIPIASRSEMNWPYERPPKPTSLRSLEIHRLREQFLGPVLSVCSNLQTLHYRWLLHNGVDQPHSETPLELTEMASNIASHCSHTLTTLWIDAATQLSPGYYDDPPLEFSGSLAPLKELTALERLGLPWPFVCGSVDSPFERSIRNVAPASLRYLQLARQLVRYEEFWWTPAELLGLIAAEMDAGLLQEVPRLEGIRTSLARTMRGVKVDGEVLQEMDRLRADHLQVDVDEPDCSVYISTRPDSQVRHHI